MQLASTYRTKAISSAKVKKDPVDARMLAHLLRSDRILPCYTGTIDSMCGKQLLRYEIQLVREKTRALVPLPYHQLVADLKRQDRCLARYAACADHLRAQHGLSMNLSLQDGQDQNRRMSLGFLQV